MNKIKLQEVMTEIEKHEKIPGLGFTYRTFVAGALTFQGDYTLEERVCNSTACVAGTAVLMNLPKDEIIKTCRSVAFDWNSKAGNILELDYIQSQFLFHTASHLANKDDAIARIKWLLEDKHILAYQFRKESWLRDPIDMNAKERDLRKWMEIFIHHYLPHFDKYQTISLLQKLDACYPWLENLYWWKISTMQECYERMTEYTPLFWLIDTIQLKKEKVERIADNIWGGETDIYNAVSNRYRDRITKTQPIGPIEGEVCNIVREFLSLEEVLINIWDNCYEAWAEWLQIEDHEDYVRDYLEV